MIHAKYAILQIAHLAIQILVVLLTIIIWKELAIDAQSAVLVAQMEILVLHVTVVLVFQRTQLIPLANVQMVTMV